MKSVVGIDGGLATTGLAHVRLARGAYQLVAGHVYSAPQYPDDGSAVETMLRVRDLYGWLGVRLGQAVTDGAESFHAERFEHVRSSSAAAKYAAGHAALALACSNCEPRPKLQALGSGLPEYIPAGDVKRALTGCAKATKRVMVAAARRHVVGASEALHDMLAEARPHLADAIGVAMYALGHCTNPAICGDTSEIHDLELSGVGHSVIAQFDWHDPIRETSVFTGGAVVFVGAKMARRHGLDDEPLRWTELRHDSGVCMAAWLPYPALRWWRSPANQAKARTFLRAALRVA